MLKKLSVFGLLLAVIWQTSLPTIPVAAAASIRDVAINEIAWAGSRDNSADEWIELYNNTASSIDLTGWIIEDDNGAQNYPLTGSIAAHGYFLLESRESATSIPGDIVHTTSLSNSGDSLVLKDSSQNIIDSVNESSVAWPAGNNTTHASMERINTLTDGNVSSNWQTSTTTSAATASTGSAIIGTPKALNSVSTITPTAPTITLTADRSTVNTGETLTIAANINNGVNVSDFGLDITYDPSKLHYLSSSEGNFLNANGTVPTSFQSALQNNTEGLVVIGNARTVNPLTGANGSGELFHLTFNVLATAEAGSSSVTITNQSFISTPSTHITVSAWPSTSITINASTATIEPVSNLIAEQGTDRYSITLHWNASPSSSVHYAIYRENAHHIPQLLGNTDSTSFTDHEGTSNGGNIIPHLSYTYQVIATNDAQQSAPIITHAEDSRGLKGDNNRTDRVDGNDLEKIARLWTIDDTQADFSPLVDTSFDGTVNGSDLIDLAVSWAKTYP